MENAVTNCPFPPQLREEDRAVFERVWRRVMPEERPDCPITLEPTPAVTLQGGDLPCTCLCPRTAEPAPALVIREGGCPHLSGDFPDEGEVPRLGPASAVHGKQLQRQTLDALESWQLYRHLARRAGGGACARTLAALAAEQHRAARRLAAAYFLISGVRWWPMDRLPPLSAPSFQGTLRREFQREQQRSGAYDTAAADTRDEALTELYRELAAQSRDRSAALRSVLEQCSF